MLSQLHFARILQPTQQQDRRLTRPDCTTKLTDVALAKVLGLPAMPKQIALTIVDFPVPFGPMIKFKARPGKHSTRVYVLLIKNIFFNTALKLYHWNTYIKSLRAILRIDPFVNPSEGGESSATEADSFGIFPDNVNKTDNNNRFLRNQNYCITDFAELIKIGSSYREHTTAAEIMPPNLLIQFTLLPDLLASLFIQMSSLFGFLLFIVE